MAITGLGEEEQPSRFYVALRYKDRAALSPPFRKMGAADVVQPLRDSGCSTFRFESDAPRRSERPSFARHHRQFTANELFSPIFNMPPVFLPHSVLVSIKHWCPIWFPTAKHSPIITTVTPRRTRDTKSIGLLARPRFANGGYTLRIVGSAETRKI